MINEKSPIENSSVDVADKELAAVPATSPKARCIGWETSKSDGGTRFICYTKKRLLGPDKEFHYLSLVLKKASNLNGHVLWRLDQVKRFEKGWQAADNAMLQYCREQGLKLPDGMSELPTKEQKLRLRKKYPILNHRSVLRVQMLFPWDKEGQLPQEEAPEPHAVDEAGEDDKGISVLSSIVALLYGVATWLRRMLAGPVRSA